MRLSIILVALAFLVAGDLYAQHSTVTVLGSDHLPLIYATVRFTCLDGGCSDSTSGRLTDAQGKAVNPYAARTTIRISYVGYKPLHDTLAARENRTYQLQVTSTLTQEVVVTGQYTPRSNELSLYNVQVLDRQRIQTQGATNLRELMATELNVRLGEDQVLGSSMSIQGLSGQNVKIMIDGVPVIGRVNGNVDLSQISMANVERVEMIQGPLSVMYGTDALGGVINIITDHRVQPGIQGRLESYAESVGAVNFSGELRYRTGNTAITASGGRNFFGGYSPVDTSRFKEWKPREQYTAALEVAQTIDQFRLGYNGRYFQEYILNRGEPRTPYRETAFDDTYRTYRTTHSLSLNGAPTADSYVDGVVSVSTYQRRKNTFFRNLVTLDQQITADPTDQDTTDLTAWNIRGTYSNDNQLAPIAWQGGIDINMEAMAGKRIGGENRTIGDYAIFGSLQYRPISAVVLQPAVRYAWNSSYAAPLVPSFNVRIAPAESLAVRLSYARGFRAPSLRDLYFLFVDINHNIRGNEDLKAEASHSIHADLDWRMIVAPGEITITPSFFYNDVMNLITLAQVDNDLYSYVNIGEHRTLGGNIQAQLHNELFDLRLGASLLGHYNQLSDDYDISSYSFSPEARAELTWQPPLLDTRLAVFYKFTGRQPSFQMNANGELREGYIGDYHTLDLSLTHEFLDGAIRITAGAKNLLDVREIESTTVSSEQAHAGNSSHIPVAWGRSFYVSTTFTVGE